MLRLRQGGIRERKDYGEEGRDTYVEDEEKTRYIAKNANKEVKKIQ